MFIINENEVWKSNGTEDGTIIVPDALPETFSLSFQYGEYLNTNSSLFFIASDGVHGGELWVFKDEKLAETVSPLCETGFDPQTIKKGEGTALWWWSQNATAGSINNGIGEISLPSDYKWIYPTETTTYTMTAKGTNGITSTCEATVVVEPGSLSPICEMGADPKEITAGEGTALWWWSQNVSSATINNEKWSVSVPSDYAWFYPSETAVYTMTAMGEDGSTTSCNTMITVNPQQCTKQTSELTNKTSDIKASGNYNSFYTAKNAFDKVESSMWISAVGETPAWISYSWGVPRIINKYSIKYKNGRIKTRAPKDWQLQGWNGSKWITTDSRTNETNWAGTETRNFTVATPGNYNKYRLYFTDDNDERDGVEVISIGDISLETCK